MSHSEIKDRRSYEHSRQQQLHPSDRCTSRSNNAWKRHVGNSTKGYTYVHPTAGTKWLPRLARDDVGLDSDLDYVGPYEDDGRGEFEDDPTGSTRVPPLEVNLSDLVRPARQRKGLYSSPSATLCS